MTKEDITAPSVLAAAQQRLNSRRPSGVILKALAQGMRQEQDWWYVPVRPDRHPLRRYEYYEALADVEQELQRDEHITVLFVPVAPQESAESAAEPFGRV